MPVDRSVRGRLVSLDRFDRIVDDELEVVVLLWTGAKACDDTTTIDDDVTTILARVHETMLKLEAIRVFWDLDLPSCLLSTCDGSRRECVG